MLHIFLSWLQPELHSRLSKSQPAFGMCYFFNPIWFRGIKRILKRFYDIHKKLYTCSGKHIFSFSRIFFCLINIKTRKGVSNLHLTCIAEKKTLIVKLWRSSGKHPRKVWQPKEPIEKRLYSLCMGTQRTQSDMHCNYTRESNTVLYCQPTYLTKILFYFLSLWLADCYIVLFYRVSGKKSFHIYVGR